MTTTPALIANLLSRLQAQLPAKIAAQGQPAIKTWRDNYPGEPRPQEAPAVWLEDVSMADDLVAMGGTAGLQDRSYHILVGVTASGANTSAMALAARTYRDLIIPVLEGDQTAGATVGSGGGVVYDVECIDSSKTVTPLANEQLFVQYVILFEVKAEALVGVD